MSFRRAWRLLAVSARSVRYRLAAGRVGRLRVPQPTREGAATLMVALQEWAVVPEANSAPAGRR